LEASALTHASRLGLLGRRSPLLRLQGDERLIAMIREGHERAFEALFERYQVRLLAFCRGMLGSAEDAEDVLQEVFVAAHRAILGDNRAINARPWLYRIARNRCLNHLRKPVPEGQDSMDVHPHENGVSVADRVQKREEFRALIADVSELPETQRTALLLREIDALAYEDIAVAMETTVPAVKSLLVRARMSLADCSQGRHLTCDDVHLELAEAAEGLRKASGPARAHMRGCEPCREYRAELRRNGRALAALAPIGPLAALSGFIGGKLGIGGGTKLGAGSGATAGGGAAAGTGTAVGTGGAAIGSGGAAMGGAAAGGGGFSIGAAAGGIGGAIGTKAAAGVASVALITAGAVEVNNYYRVEADRAPVAERTMAAVAGPASRAEYHVAPGPAESTVSDPVSDHPIETLPASEPVDTTVAPVPATEESEPAPVEERADDDGVAGGADSGTGFADGPEGGITSTPPLPPPPSDPTPVEPAPGEPPPVSEPTDPAPEPEPVQPAEG
jgi:RNA polymerase sigma factor (sigma-70 family)